MNRTFVLVFALLGLWPGAGTSQTTERLYQQACDGGDMTACNVFGLMNETGQGIAQDLPRAVDLYQRACEPLGSTNFRRLQSQPPQQLPQLFGKRRFHFHQRIAARMTKTDALRVQEVSIQGRAGTVAPAQHPRRAV